MPTEETFAAIERECAEYLHEKRKEAKLTRQTVADRLGRKSDFLYRLETGRQRLWVVDFVEIAKALAMDPTEALNEVLAGRLSHEPRTP